MGILSVNVKTFSIFSGNNVVLSPKYLTIPVISDEKCAKKNSKAFRKGRLCMTDKKQKSICSVSLSNFNKIRYKKTLSEHFYDFLM